MFSDFTAWNIDWYTGNLFLKKRDSRLHFYMVSFTVFARLHQYKGDLNARKPT